MININADNKANTDSDRIKISAHKCASSYTYYVKKYLKES